VTPGEDLRHAEYTDPQRSCDVVMKGGITSGVVYPHAVCELAQSYRFRNVGGTSAGAIAAAATAAAEYGRAADGFRKLAGLPGEIGAEGKLQSLFQPQRSTKRLFAILIAALEGGPARACRTALRQHLPMFLLGALPGLALLAFAVGRGFASRFDPLVVVSGAVGLLLALAGGAVAVAVRVAVGANRSIADNGFGLCSGGPSGDGGEPALTPWLTDLIDDLAGTLPAGEPLTFGRLWAGPDGDPRSLPADPDERHLQLAMMTTNLVNRRAHQLPWDNREWFFDPDEFGELFPSRVVEWMKGHPPQPRPGDTPADVRATRIRWALMRPRLPLPSAADLPVVVATRMSLSFPVLLSAVPLWTIDMTRKDNDVLEEWRDWAREQPDAWDPLAAEGPSEWPVEGRPAALPVGERCWFSDGGISSNFPVHFFDRLVPRWPTFAINLRPFAMGEEPDPTDQAKNASMVKTNKDEIRNWWYRLPDRPGGLGLRDGRLFAFLSSVVRTMQNRVDEAQMRVPGYRDRIAHVKMSQNEGGMNLTMPPPRIAALTARGRAAAELLHAAYTPPDGLEKEISWDNHRWVRLRSSLAVLEEMHRHFADGYALPPELEEERTYAELLHRGQGELPNSYRWRHAGQLPLASLEIEAILDAVEAYSPGISVAREAPNPAPIGRISPRD
jgi:predicted acylesterase/phospholipase RssA